MCPCKDTHFLNIEVDSIKIVDILQANNLQANIPQTNNMNRYYNINNNISNNIYIEPNYDSGEYNWSFNQNNMNYLINYINANYTIAVDTHMNCKCKKEEVCGCGCDDKHYGWIGTEGYDIGPIKGLVYF